MTPSLEPDIADDLGGFELPGHTIVEQRREPAFVTLIMRDIVNDRACEVRLLRPHLSNDDVWIARVHREIEAHRQLTHAGIRRLGPQRCLDHPTPHPWHFLQFTGVEGPTLTDVLGDLAARGLTPPIRLVRSLALALSGALSHAHGTAGGGISHGALTPDRIVLPRGNVSRAMIGGFGNALFDRTRTRCTDYLTDLDVDYLSPEQIVGARVGPATDLYSLGVILYAFATGRVPFPEAAGDPGAVLAAHVRQRPAPPSSLRAEIPAWLDGTILALLDKHPDRRVAGAEALTDLLTHEEAPPAHEGETVAPRVDVGADPVLGRHVAATATGIDPAHLLRVPRVGRYRGLVKAVVVLAVVMLTAYAGYGAYARWGRTLPDRFRAWGAWTDPPGAWDGPIVAQADELLDRAEARLRADPADLDQARYFLKAASELTPDAAIAERIQPRVASIEAYDASMARGRRAVTEGNRSESLDAYRQASGIYRTTTVADSLRAGVADVASTVRNMDGERDALVTMCRAALEVLRDRPDLLPPGDTTAETLQKAYIRLTQAYPRYTSHTVLDIGVRIRSELDQGHYLDTQTWTLIRRDLLLAWASQPEHTWNDFRTWFDHLCRDYPRLRTGAGLSIGELQRTVDRLDEERVDVARRRRQADDARRFEDLRPLREQIERLLRNTPDDEAFAVWRYYLSLRIDAYRAAERRIVASLLTWLDGDEVEPAQLRDLAARVDAYADAVGVNNRVGADLAALGGLRNKIDRRIIPVQSAER